MISDQYRCIFVHIPRTGGTSIEDVIWPKERTERDLWMGFRDRYHNKYQTGGLQHLLARQIRQEVGQRRFDIYFKFSFVRNPFDRAISQFSYMRRRDDLREFIGMGEHDDFEKYLHLIRDKKHVQWEEQWRFVYEASACLMDFVARFENIDADAAVILSRLGIDGAVLPHRNKSDRRVDYRAYYNDHTKNLVAKMYEKDLELFGYRFG